MGNKARTEAGTRGLCLRRLRENDRPEVAAFYRRLDRQSRYMRFQTPASSGFIQRHVDAIDMESSYVLGAVDAKGELQGVGELHGDREGHEIAVAVSSDVRGKGLGWALSHHLRERARRRGARSLFASMLADNRPMLRISRRLGMRETRRGNDVTARLAFASDKAS